MGTFQPHSVADERPGDYQTKDRRINNCRAFKVAITLRVMIANKNGTVIDSLILSNNPEPPRPVKKHPGGRLAGRWFKGENWAPQWDGLAKCWRSGASLTWVPELELGTPYQNERTYVR